MSRPADWSLGVPQIPVFRAGPLESARVWPTRTGRSVTPLNRQDHRQMLHLQQAPLPHPIKELIIDFLALLSNCLMIAFLRAVNRVKMAPNSIPRRRNQSSANHLLLTYLNLSAFA